MNILLTNDDGVYAQGIIALAKFLKIDHRVFVVAPDVERSGCSHSITLERPLSAKRATILEYDGVEAYAINGTPADCVKIGLDVLVKEEIDLVVSGINFGANLGTDIAYSGTVNAALEGCICGVPSIAVSQRLSFPIDHAERPVLLEISAQLTAQMIGDMDFSRLDGYIYNINFPALPKERIKGIRVCEQGISWYDSVYKKQNDPFGREHYWIFAEKNRGTYNDEHETDVKWSEDGFVTVTPLAWNDTCQAAMEQTKCNIENIKLHL